ncbi:hypothetical protein [Aureibacter tunicatorum]|uniref:Outer membrane protein beta-barrel domain-containing protein n=1 Tax=Aureibacter tunicatorum TaxID=866807 RepID=A0AAE3XQQ8_9BACT|nr:hypothetical protein [Aureibacter tunicatorum]MDR6240210.1 hypothetical protein [Aureibacter tunicatorum]BDD05909.1 hypothetical protein AUTU_33920 [Aureibacter tunicatorum]
MNTTILKAMKVMGLLFISLQAQAQSYVERSVDDYSTIIDQSHDHHNKYELEVSYNDGKHFEFTGSVYFAELTKVQATAEVTGHHYAAVVVRELPFRHSRFGTFFGVGSTFAIEEDMVSDLPGVQAGRSPDSGVGVHEERDLGVAIVLQSGLAYALDDHWSTGFTYSPGVDVNDGHFVHGLTIDLVFGF